MGIFLYICCIFAEHIVWRTPMEDNSWICNVIKLVKMILKSFWYFTYLNYPLLLKLFFYNWCNCLIFMYKISKCWEFKVLLTISLNNLSSCTYFSWYNAHFTVSYFLSEIFSPPSDDRGSNIDSFYLFFKNLQRCKSVKKI